MADSKHTITIKSEDSGKSRGVGGSGGVGGGDFLKIFQQEVAKLKEAILQENPEMSRGDAQRQAQREASEQLRATRRRNEGVVEPSSTGDDEELKLASPIEINPRTILPEDPIGFEEDSDEDIVRSQDMLRKMASSRNEPTKSPGLEADEGTFDDPSDQLKSTVSEEDEDEDFYKNLLDKEEQNASLRAVFGVNNDEGTFDDADDQLQDDEEKSSEASNTTEEDAVGQLVESTVEKEDKEEPKKDKGKYEKQVGDAGEAIGSTFFGEAGGVVGRKAGERIGQTLDIIDPMDKLKRLGRGAKQAGSSAVQAVSTSTGDVAGAMQTTADASTAAVGGMGELAGDMLDAMGLGILGDVVRGVADQFGEMAAAAAKLITAIDKSSEEVAAFNPQILGERIETDLDMLFKKMDRAQKVGDEFAEFEAAKGDTMSVFEDIKTALLKVMTPIATGILKIITKLLETLLSWLPEIINFFALALEALAYVVDWLDGSGVSAVQQAILDGRDWLRKTSKEIEQWHDEDKEKEEKNFMGEIDQWLTGGFLENDHIGAVGPAPPGVI
jgi:hypothetical protein